MLIHVWERVTMTTEWLLPEVDLDICTQCGQCVDKCPESVVAMAETGPVFVRPDACSYCGVCETICPEGAVELSYVITWDASLSLQEPTS